MSLSCQRWHAPGLSSGGLGVAASKPPGTRPFSPRGLAPGGQPSGGPSGENTSCYSVSRLSGFELPCCHLKLPGGLTSPAGETCLRGRL